MNASKPFAVRIVYCDHRAGDDEVYEALRRATLPLERAWQKLESARKVLIKLNIVWPPERIAYFEGRHQELVDLAVTVAVLRLLAERIRAELIVADTSLTRTGSDFYFKPILEEFGVKFIESSEPPLQFYDVPGGLMFRRYLLTSHLAEADAVVSVAKLKSHAFTGVTFCTKNLFGWLPLPPRGRPRTYFHHLVRLPYVVADLGRLVNPCLSIVDGLVGQSGREWGGQRNSLAVTLGNTSTYR